MSDNSSSADEHFIEQSRKVVKTKDAGKSKCQKKKWDEATTNILIDLLEERPCLWDIFHNEYTKRDKREVAYTEIEDRIEFDIKEIKTKVHNLRAQLGRELNKVRKTKSGQSTNERYKSSWVYWERLQFLVPQMQPSKQKDNLDISVANVEVDDNDQEFETTPPKKVKHNTRLDQRKQFEEKRLDVLNKCTNLLTQENEPKQEVSPFVLYIDQKLKDMDQRTRFVTEKKISDILYEAQFQMLSPTQQSLQNPQRQQGGFIQGQGNQTNYYTSLLDNSSELPHHPGDFYHQ